MPFVIFSSFSKELAQLQVSSCGLFVKFLIKKKKKKTSEVGFGLGSHLEHLSDI